MELASETLVKYTFDGISSDAVKKTVGNSSPIALNESIECKEENNPVTNLTNKFLLKKLSEVEAQLLATPGNNVEESLEMQMLNPMATQPRVSEHNVFESSLGLPTDKVAQEGDDQVTLPVDEGQDKTLQ